MVWVGREFSTKVAALSSIVPLFLGACSEAMMQMKFQCIKCSKTYRDLASKYNKKLLQTRERKKKIKPPIYFLKKKSLFEFYKEMKMSDYELR